MLQSLCVKTAKFRELSKKDGIWRALKSFLYRLDEAVPVVRELATLKRPEYPEWFRELELIEIGGNTNNDRELKYHMRSRALQVPMKVHKGYRSFVLTRGDSVIADVWYVTKASAKAVKVHPDVDLFKFGMGPRDVYLFDMYAAPDERGNSLSTLFMRSVLCQLGEQGFERAYGYFVASNVAALWVHRLIGYKEMDRVMIRKWLSFKSARRKQ